MRAPRNYFEAEAMKKAYCEDNRAAYRVFVLARLEVYEFAKVVAKRWEYLGRTTILLPNEGESCHSGPLLFRRFIAAMDRALAEQWDVLVLAEYDTLPLSERRWPVKPGALLSALWHVNGDRGDEMECASMSPWIFGRVAAERFVSAARGELQAPVYGGLLDRWIGHVADLAGLPLFTSGKFHAHPPEAIYDAAKAGCEMIHPVKDLATVERLMGNDGSSATGSGSAAHPKQAL